MKENVNIQFFFNIPPPSIILIFSAFLLIFPLKLRAMQDEKELIKRYCEKCEILHKKEVFLPFSEKYLKKIKAFNLKKNSFDLIVFDDKENFFDEWGLKQLEKEESIVQFNKIGYLTPFLHSYLSKLSEDDEVRVAIFLKDPYPQFNKENITSFYLEKVAYETQKIQVAFLIDEFLKESSKINYKLHLKHETVPYIVATVKKKDIPKLNFIKSIGFVDLHTWLQSAGTTWADTVMRVGLYATEVDVGIIEDGEPDNYQYLLGVTEVRNDDAAELYPPGDNDEHARMVWGVLYETLYPYGIARESKIYFADFCYYLPEFNYYCKENNYHDWEKAEQWLNDRFVRIRNHSFIIVAQSTWADNFIDYLVKRPPYPFFARGAGNIPKTGDCVTNTSYNTLIIGASNENGDSNRENDTIANFSAWKNCFPSGSDRELPEIVAPGVNITAANITDNGTSFSTPMVAGAAAILMYYNPILQYWPEALRAILMAGADEDVDGTILNLEDDIDDHDGAGELNILHSYAIAHKDNRVLPGNFSVIGHDFRTLYKSDCPKNICKYKYYVGPGYDNWKLRVVIAWDSQAQCYSPLKYTSCYFNKLDADLDIGVYEFETGILRGWSVSYNNSYEFVQIPVIEGRNYEIVINAYNWREKLPGEQEPFTFYGIAFSIFPYEG